MLLCKWKVKGIIASVFNINYRSKEWISGKIVGRLITGSSEYHPLMNKSR